jgi:circadian clock protein KaiC
VTFNLHGFLGAISPDIDASYLADTVVLMRHFEAGGLVRQCISVLKKRHGRHERSIREVEICPGGLRLGPPLREFSGVLTGTPRYEGRREDLLEQRGESPGGRKDN